MASVTGGDTLGPVLQDIADRLTKATEVQVGFLEDATYPDGTSVAMVAAIQEFGAPEKNIPPRPFFRSMIAAKSGEWPDALADALKVSGNDAEIALALVGDGIKGQLQQSIIDFSAPPLAATTVRAKGFDKPLVDTGVMLGSVDYEVT